MKKNLNNSKKERQVILILTLFSFIAISIMLIMIDPIPQDTHYHNFADTRELWSINNFWNVFSNLPFFLVGTLALYKMLKVKSLTLLTEAKSSYILLFLGVSMVAFGSGFYHLHPSNETLIWDRLPMTIAFMALFSIVLSEFIHEKIAKKALFPLLLLGFASVTFWYFGELKGEGDLRYYALVQFLPMILIPTILLLFKSKFTKIQGYWWLLFCYLLAKLFEYFDLEIYEFLKVISGHSLKHMVAAIGLYILLHSFEKRLQRL